MAVTYLAGIPCTVPVLVVRLNDPVARTATRPINTPVFLPLVTAARTISPVRNPCTTLDCLARVRGNPYRSIRHICRRCLPVAVMSKGRTLRRRKCSGVLAPTQLASIQCVLGSPRLVRFHFVLPPLPVSRGARLPARAYTIPSARRSAPPYHRVEPSGTPGCDRAPPVCPARTPQPAADPCAGCRHGRLGHDCSRGRCPHGCGGSHGPVPKARWSHRNRHRHGSTSRGRTRATQSPPASQLVGIARKIGLLQELRVELRQFNRHGPDGTQAEQACNPGEHVLEPTSQRGRQPARFPTAICKASGTVARVPLPPASSGGTSFGKRHPLPGIHDG